MYTQCTHFSVTGNFKLWAPSGPMLRGSSVYNFVHFESILSETSQHHHTQSLPKRDDDITNIHCIRHLCNVCQPQPLQMKVQHLH